MSITWPHIVEDNFLSRDHYKNLFQYRDLKLKSDTDIAIIKNKIWINGKTEGQLPANYLAEFYKDYSKKFTSYLEKLAPEKVPLVKWLELNLVFTGKLYKFPIHEDSANKLLSVVVYLYPKLNTGTILYSDQSGNDKTIIEWVPNRALIFSREGGVTWHSYEGDGISTRYALVANLRSDT